MSLFVKFLGEEGEKLARGPVDSMVKTWIADGWLEPTRESECVNGIMDVAEALLGQVAENGRKAAP